MRESLVDHWFFRRQESDRLVARVTDYRSGIGPATRGTNLLRIFNEPTTSLTRRLSHLASIFAAGIVAVYAIFCSFLSLRLIATRFDFRVFHAELALAGDTDCHRPSIAK
jgi:hypothetical protein